MYEQVFQFFGLRENPFHASPDPRFYFSTPAHRSALGELMVGADVGQGLFVLTGEPGTGKTVLLHQFLSWLESRQQSSCYIFQPQLKPLELFQMILQDFGVPCHSRHKSDLLMALSHWLLKRRRMGDSPVLIIDEAQGLSLRTLDRLSMLLNLEAQGNRLLQIVLSGQPKLEEKLQRRELRHLHKRMFRCSLLPLSMEETSAYIKSRLAAVGVEDMTVFSEESLEAVYAFAQGIPRVVNLLCEHALIAAYSEKCRVIPREVVARVAVDFDLSSNSEAADEQEALLRFGQLVPLRPGEEMMPEVVREVEQAAVEVETARELEAKVAPDPAVTPTMNELHSLAEPAEEERQTVVPFDAPKPAYPEIAPNVAAPKRPRRQELPINWKRPRVNARFVLYSRAAKQSFVKDWEQFSRARAWAKLMKALQPIILAAPKSVAAASSMITPVRLKVAKVAAAKGAGRQEIPVNWKLPSVGMRFESYWRAVKQSFAKDWEQFLRAHARAKKASEPVIAISVKPVAATSPVMPSTTPKVVVKMAASKRADRREAPTSGTQRGVVTRLSLYWRGVEQSFVKDWKRFLQAHAQNKKAPGADSSTA